MSAAVGKPQKKNEAAGWISKGRKELLVSFLYGLMVFYFLYLYTKPIQGFISSSLSDGVKAEGEGFWNARQGTYEDSTRPRSFQFGQDANGNEVFLPLYHVPQPDGTTLTMALEAQEPGRYLFLNPFETEKDYSPDDDSTLDFVYTGNLADLKPVGEDLPEFKVSIGGETRILAMTSQDKNGATFIDPKNPDKEYSWSGNPATLKKNWQLDLRPQNYKQAFEKINYWRALKNSLLIAGISTFGAVLSAVLVAYGFSRFRIPGKDAMRSVLVATMIIPYIVTLIPLYTLFYKFGWIGTILPLTIPYFFANGYNVFLLETFFRNVPKELDEAAFLDGASPLKILTSIMLPLTWPAIIAVGINHFIFSWNDFLGQMWFLGGKPELATINTAIVSFNSQYGGRDPHLVTAATLVASVVPIALFLIAQKPFMKAMTMAGVDR